MFTEFLDLLVLGWIVAMKDIETQQRTNNASAANAASASAAASVAC